jgi:uncharacterized protein
MTSRPMAWAGLLAALLLAGCFGSAGTSAYYTLNPAVPGSGAPENRAAARLIVGLGPLSLPDYLDRPAIVTRIGPNRLAVNEGHRWAGPLKSEIARVIADDLESLTGARRVVIFPWSVELEPDLKVRIDIQAFEGRPGGKVKLKAAWQLTPGRSDQPAVQRVSLIETDVQGDDFDGLAAAMSRALADLSRQVADAASKAMPVQ